MSADPLVPARTDQHKSKRGRLPYYGVLLAALFVTASEVCLKKSADNMPAVLGALSWVEIQTLFSGWLLAGIICYIISFIFWLKVLQVLPLNIAFNLVNIEHIFVPLASYLFLGEEIGLMRAAGVGIVLLGVWVIAEAYCRAEERV